MAGGGQQFLDILTQGTLGTKGPTNVVRLAADQTGTVFRSVKGAPFVRNDISPGLMGTFMSNAAYYLGTQKLWFWGRQLDGLSLDFTTFNSGTGTTGTNVQIPDSLDSINGLGGARRMTTSTAVDGSARMAAPDFSVVVPTIAFNDNTKWFYRAQRMRLITAPTADTITRLGSFNWAGGVHGTGSTTKYVCRLNGTGTYIQSTVSIDTNWHTFEEFYVGFNAFYSVDGENPVGVPAGGLWPLVVNQSFAEIGIMKVGNAVDHQMDISTVIWGGVLP